MVLFFLSLFANVAIVVVVVGGGGFSCSLLAARSSGQIRPPDSMKSIVLQTNATEAARHIETKHYALWSPTDRLASHYSAYDDHYHYHSALPF